MSAEPARLAPGLALLQARIIAFGMLASALVVAVIAVVVILGGENAPAESAGATMLFGLWVAAAIGTTAGWWILWRGATGLVAAAGARVEIEAGRLGPGHVLQRLVWAYALLEGQMMVALVASFLQRTPMLLVPAFAIMALGILLSFPRREWFAPFAGTSRSVDAAG